LHQGRVGWVQKAATCGETAKAAERAVELDHAHGGAATRATGPEPHRPQNNSDQAQEVTVRIFLAPEPWVEDSTAWIEMDRFMQPLEGSERTVVFRPARLSAVIRKPAVGHEELEGTKPRDPATIWCDCGWPYTLLLPRGTKEGLDFRLLVMVSGDDLAMDNTGEKCTSMGYCGVERKPYPDKRPMGYPFDRPLPYSISSIIDKHENWASRKIRIRCRS
jgi:tyrosinase